MNLIKDTHSQEWKSDKSVAYFPKYILNQTKTNKILHYANNIPNFLTYNQTN